MRSPPNDLAYKGQLLLALDALKKGDFSVRLPRDREGIDGRIADAINDLAELNQRLAAELARVTSSVCKDGNLSERIRVGEASGAWTVLSESVDQLLDDLTRPMREVARILGAVEKGDLDQSVPLEVGGRPLAGEFLTTARTVNAMVSGLASFAAEVTRVTREVGTEGKLGGQALVAGVGGTWKDLTDSVNQMAANLTNQVRDIAAVTTAVASGDLSKKITADVRGEILELKDTINTMVDQLRSFASEVTRVASEVGMQGRLGGQAVVPGVAGTWKDLTESVNSMASNLTSQVRNIAAVTTAVARGDLTRKITVDVKGEILELKDTVNTMVDQLRSFASEVTRVAREVGTEGQLGGQAEVEGGAGTWKSLTESVNSMASNLTGQVRNIAEVSRAIARGDLSKKITVDAQGEILELKDTINTMVDQLRAFAAEVTRVAHEVGVQGELGGQAKVPGVAGTWRDLTENVNQLAANLTTQVRAIADVATSVAKGDLTRTVQVDARGEVAVLKDNINEMIRNLAQQTLKNSEQDWLKTNLAKFSRMLQGQRDLQKVSELVLTELADVVGVRQGLLYSRVAETASRESSGAPELRKVAGYATSGEEEAIVPFGHGLIGQCALEKRKVLLAPAPEGFIRIASGLGESKTPHVMILPVMFEREVMGVLELASLRPFSPAHELLLDQLCEGIGIVCKNIEGSSRTEALLLQSQALARELQAQQRELRRSNHMLEEKAELLAERNQEVEQARKALEEKAEQITLASKYKSEFLATVSHELRAPLNSLLILSEQLLRNKDKNLSTKQVEFCQTIHDAGEDLLGLINDILDLSKIESGTVTLELEDLQVSELVEFVERTFRPVAESKDLEFVIQCDADLPPAFQTDVHRLQQVLRNLLSNAFKFTERGSVQLRVSVDRSRPGIPALSNAEHVLAFAVTDTGIGIARDKHEIIFESFRQADGGTSRRYGGTGLGLAISRELAHLLGGEITLESTPGIGSTFTLFLRMPPPAAPARSSPATDPAARGAPGPRLVRLQDPATTPDAFAGLVGRTVLVVDDDFRNLFTMINALEPYEMQVRACDSGQEALEILRTDPRIDAVLIDIMMPGLDGYDTIRAIRKMESHARIPIIALTAKAMRGDRQRCLEAGASDYISKPVPVDRLLSVLSQWLPGGAKRE